MDYNKFLSSLGASERETTELINYNTTFFRCRASEAGGSFPLPDEPFVKAWEVYIKESAEKGVFSTLQEKLVQLLFPVQKGISRDEHYRASTLRGLPPVGLSAARELMLERPGDLELHLYPTPAGRIPVLFVGHRPDFVCLVQALSRQNEPERIPDSMNACLVKGFNNWDRIRTYREKWAKANPGRNSQKDWREEFQRLILFRELYQDKFVILGNGPYSGVPAKELGFSEAEWLCVSRVIRLGHETAHYFTLRVLGSARNHAYDELIADCMGISEAAGSFRPDWFLRFMGLENYPAYRDGGRLENYLGNPPLSAGAFKILQSLVKKASENMGKICRLHGKTDTPEAKAELLLFLAKLSLIDLAGNSRENLNLY